MANAFENQIENRNYLYPNTFNFTLTKYQKVSFFSKSANIPGISLGNAKTTNISKKFRCSWRYIRV